MTTASFAKHRKAWSSPPLDDIGYIPSSELLEMQDDSLLALIEQVERNRYSHKGWRNWNGAWRDVLGLDTTRDKIVLDYGCGIGLEALQYAKLGNTTLLADISEGNVILAARVLRLFGYEPGAEIVLWPGAPFAALSDDSLDVIHCNGVLHHIAKPKPVVQQFGHWLKPGGQLRLMLYSDQAWRVATNTEPPEDTVNAPEFQTYVRHWDAVGSHADWYDRPKLHGLCSPFGFEIVAYEPLTRQGEYVAAVLIKR